MRGPRRWIPSQLGVGWAVVVGAALGPLPLLLRCLLLLLLLLSCIGGLDPGVTRKWLAGRLAGCCLLIDRLHGLNS
eukprot:COSAG01_NODE_5133_length_4460_cov_4.745359_6_plen_75_part_01